MLCYTVLCCAGLSCDTAMSLLLVVWPLCRVRSDLQDFVVMLLRKMMYRQDVDGRCAGACLFILYNGCVSGSKDQQRAGMRTQEPSPNKQCWYL